MKKGILLVLIAITSFIIVSCAAHEHPADTNAKITDITEEFKTLTREEAYQKTANDLYMGALTQNGFNYLLSLLTEIEKGSLQGYPIGDITSPYVAAVILQKLYTTMQNLPDTISATEREILAGIADPVKIETNYGQIRSALAGLNETLYQGLSAQYSAVVSHQDIISQVVEKYANMLLTTSSSASKPSGSDDNVTVDTFYVVVNAATTISSNFTGNITGTVTDNDTVVSLIADNLYNLSDATKLQLSYNKSLRYFINTYYPQIADNDSFAMFSEVLTDFINNNGKTSGPQMGDTNTGDNATAVANPYTVYTEPAMYNGGTNATIYGVIAKRLYGAPLDPTRNYTETNSKDSFLDNNTTSYVARDNALTFYQKLREYGMKIPYGTVTSISGHKTIADIVSKHLRQNGISYKDFNVKRGEETVVTPNLFDNATTKMFTAPSTGGLPPVCALIQEVNSAIDESTISFYGNDGDYSFDFLGITAVPPITDGQPMTTPNKNNICKITLTKVTEQGAIEQYPYNDGQSLNTSSDGQIYKTQNNSTGL